MIFGCNDPHEKPDQETSGSAPSVEVFTTGGHTLYHLQPATVDRDGGRVVISAAYDGSVLCHSPSGQLRWKAETGDAFPFDLCVADLDGDGLDEVLVAAADGVLYVMDSDGKPLWTFKKNRPLYQVCVAKQDDGKSIVLAGGVENTLYSLSWKGELRGELLLKNHITRVRAGDILGQGRDMVAVATTTGALAGKLGIHLIDPRDLSIRWTRGELGSYAPNTGRRFFSMAIVDLNHDGKQDILTSGSWGQNGKIFALDQRGQPMFIQSDPRIPNIPYRMNMLVPVKLPNDEYIIGQFANILIVYNMDGACREVVTGAYAYANACFDPVTKTLYCGSSVSGGDELVAVHLDRPGWQKAFAEAPPVGKLAKIIANMKTLNQQVADFKRPSYQPEPRRVDVLLQDEYHVRSAEELRQQYQDGIQNGKHVHYVSHLVLCQKPEPGALWCRDRSAFGKYNLTADEVVAQAELWEKNGWDFCVQAGHTTALHMAPETFERVLKAAPKHLWGFEFSELGEKLDDREQEVVESVLLTLAEQCRQNGNKKILLRTKNIFWNGNIYHPFFKKVLLNKRYSDLFVPSLEETNSRTQELSLAGRIGLWQSGVFDHWASRAETDNACFNRSWEWSSQQVFSHHIRNLVSCASLGSDVYFNAIHQGPFSTALEAQIRPFYDMLEKGVVHIPQRSELISLSEVALGMHSPPSEGFLSHGTNGTRYIHPEDQPPFVFDRLDWYWGGAPMAPHDFSRYAYGLDRRMCNFLPLSPYGMVTIVPDQEIPGLNRRYTSKISTDGQSFFDEQGKAHGPAEYRSVVEAKLREASVKLPVLVQGTAHWSASRLDENHVRVTLVDPGYLDPAGRDVKIVLQQDGWTRCRDILSNEELPVQAGIIPLRIPVGSVRIVDLIRE